MSKIIVANWKMHPIKKSEAVKLIKASDDKSVIVCPPFPYLEIASQLLKKAKLGAQDVSWEDAGPLTGEVSAPMLKDLKVKTVIIGHSERRLHLGESDEMIGKKVRNSIKNDLDVLLCVGESASVRKSGSTAAKKFITQQIKNSLPIKHLTHNGKTLKHILIAYEPIWAISTSADHSIKETPELILEMVQFIHQVLNSKPYNLNSVVLYGGSVTSEDVERIIQYKEIGGALVGGASLKPAEFKKIINISKKYA
jgi:triosephosphate isomerase